MTTIELRTEIMQLLKDERDTSVLEAIRLLLYKVRQAESEEDDITDEEYAAYDGAIARHESGEGPFHTEEESMRLARQVAAA